MTKLSSASAWSRAEIAAFLDDFRAPLRISCNSSAGFPVICALWFEHRDGKILCATRKTSRIAKLLGADSRCAFELSPNEPPYYGVRGRGVASISSEGAADLLQRLIDRFLGERDPQLSRWLMGRAAEEVVIAIQPRWISSWDYSSRMSG